MTINIRNLILPISGALIASSVVSVAFWDGAKASILTALSVIGAGVLVRLARGLPFTNVDQFQVEEARRISEAIKQSIRGLRALIVVILTTMVSLVLVPSLTSAFLAKWPLAAVPAGTPPVSFFGSLLAHLSSVIEPVASGLLGFLLTYILVRVIAVIQGDVGLVDLQSEFFVRAVERKQAERYAKDLPQASELPVSNPAGYGKVVQ